MRRAAFFAMALLMSALARADYFLWQVTPTVADEECAIDVVSELTLMDIERRIREFSPDVATRCREIVDFEGVQSLRPSVSTVDVWHGTASSVPEPTGSFLLLLGMSFLALRRRERSEV